MAKHEFGIMNKAPEKGVRFDEYEPEKYNCTSVDDSIIELLDVKLIDLDCYWHVNDIKRKGLAYCGITLIPPTSHEFFINKIKESAELSELRTLFETALTENKWIIHYGL